MILATVFGFLLFLFLIFGDWYQFTTVQAGGCRYGYRVARRQDRLPKPHPSDFRTRFDQHGYLQLPHGIARFVQDQALIVIRPYYQLFSMRFRTAWPLKGTIDVVEDGDGLLLQLGKRTPWSSALVTMIWLGLVAIGTLVFVVMFAMDGGFRSAGGVLLALGIAALGILVLVFGLILVSLAYRLEDSRLMKVYQELQDALGPGKVQEK